MRAALGIALVSAPFLHLLYGGEFHQAVPLLRILAIHIPIVSDHKTEVTIVRQRSTELLERYALPNRIPAAVIDLLATVFREIRDGKTADGVSIKKPSTACSTAEAIGVALDSALHSRFFGSGQVGPAGFPGEQPHVACLSGIPLDPRSCRCRRLGRLLHGPGSH